MGIRCMQIRPAGSLEVTEQGDIAMLLMKSPRNKITALCDRCQLLYDEDELELGINQRATFAAGLPIAMRRFGISLRR